MGNHQISESCNNTVSRPSGSSSSPLVKIDSIVIDLSHIAMQKLEEGKCHHTFSIRGYVAGMREKDKKACLPFATSCDDDSTVSEVQLPPLVVPKFRWWRCENCVKDLVTDENARKDLGGGQTSLRGRKRSPFKCKPGRASSDAEKPASDVAARAQTLDKGDEPKAASCSNASLSQHAKEVNFESGVVNAHVDEVEPERVRNKEMSSGEGLKIICSNQDLGQEAHKKNHSDDDRDRGVSLPRESPLTTNTREEAVGNSLGEQGIEGSSESDGETGKARFRLLTDLLSGQTNLENTTSTNSAQASLGQNPVAYSDAGTADLEKGHRKRKIPQEPEGKVSEVGSRVNIVKKAAIDIPDSQPNPARQTKRRTEKEPGVVKKRNKLIHVDGGCSSIVPWPTTPVGSGDLKKNEGTLVEQNLKALQPPTESKKSFSAINNSRFSETGYLPTWMGESSVKRKNAEPWLHSPVGNYEIPRAVSGKVGLDLSLDSFRDPKARSMEIEFDQNGNLKKGDKTSDHKRKKGTLIREENDTLKADWPSLKGGLLCDLNAQTTIPFNGKQKNPAAVDERSLPLHKKTDYSFQKNEVKEFRRSTDAGNKHKKGQRRDEKSSEQGPPDDIPMEIVELMAQNQYERGLSEKPVQATNGYGFANGYSSPDVYGNSFTAWKSPPLNYFHRDHASKTVEENRLKLSGALPLNQAKKVPNGGSRNGFQLGEGVNPMWLGPTTNPPFGFPNSSPSQSRSKEMGAPVHKGKTISDIKANEVRKQSESHLFFSKPQDYQRAHYGTYNKNLGRPLLESYPNEAIPALQLLSLMDRNVSSSNRAFNLEKPFAPCDYHPSLNREMTHNFLDRSLFSSHQHPKLSSDLRPGVSNPGEGSRQSLPLAHHQLCFKSQEQEKSRSSYASSLLGVSKYQSPASLSSSRDMIHGSFPVREMPRGQLTLPPPITSFPFQDHMLETRHKYFDFGRGNVHGTVWPSKSMPESNICSLNQNPADFSIPEAGNVYTISWKDLKFGNRGFMRAGNVIRKRRPKITRGRMVKEAPQYVNL
ncbi:hypothetical protein DM860_007694 [Cuscuta australis]|uniref:Protein EMBRYONIC FLOWER 1-like n=1 Tax=Cuscuta australis TaxID=267555 RepID=A0A328E655_9ASTE|nr:hypothetical protein DM860_007694 [Cuscuta australis]